jgi:ABC-type glycerol-3-phosphate transport system permease component
MTRQPNARQRQIASRRRASRVFTVILSVFAVCTLFPIYYVLINAFKTLEGIYSAPMTVSPQYFTALNFFNAAVRMDYLKSLLNSLFYFGASVGIVIVLGALAGFGFGISRGKKMKRLYICIVALITIPFQLYMIPIVIEFKLMGLISTYLGTSLIYAVTGTSFTVFVYTSFMRSVPYELYEAAALDGASPVQTLLHVYLPLLKAVTVTIIIMRGLVAWNSEIIPMVSIYQQSQYNLILQLKALASSVMVDWDMVFAGTVLTTIPMTVVFLFMQRYLCRASPPAQLRADIDKRIVI